jgi:Lon protease-like protein
MTARILPMFPLGSVVFPYTIVPLRVFEPRYLTLLADLDRREDLTFGSVLIERGSEVGGGDQRFDVGTEVGLLSVEERPEGDRLILVAGRRRIRVLEWLPDDPYPLARVTGLPDVPGEVGDRPGAVRSRLTRVMALASEMGADTSGIRLDVVDDPVAASYQLSALAPLTPLDAYRLLTSPGPVDRLDRLVELLDGQIELLRATLESQ